LHNKGLAKSYLKHLKICTQLKLELSMTFSFVEHLSQAWAGQQSVTRLITLIVMNLVTSKAKAKHELLLNKMASGVGVLDKRLHWSNLWSFIYFNSYFLIYILGQCFKYYYHFSCYILVALAALCIYLCYRYLRKVDCSRHFCLQKLHNKSTISRHKLLNSSKVGGLTK